MKKIFYCLSLIMMIFIFTGCFNEPDYESDLDKAFKTLKKTKNEKIVKVFYTACKKDIAKGCNYFGVANGRGLGTKKDYKIAKESFEKAISLGHSDAYGNLGFMYQRGYGVRENKKTALKYFKQGCKKGSGFSCTRIGLMEMEKKFYKPFLANEYYQEGCTKGDSLGCHKYAINYFEGRGTKNTWKLKAIPLFEKNCEKGNTYGNALSCDFYAKKYFDKKISKITEEKTKKALNYYSKACDIGLTYSCVNLAILYEKGIFVKENKSKVKEFYKKACEKGDERSCNKF